jgi:hypothetical protein
LGWAKAADTVVVSGKPSKSDLESCWDLGATLAAQLMESREFEDPLRRAP